jgi:ubiquinone/menaquinone biosynthesis C-methylase UbiE
MELNEKVKNYWEQEACGTHDFVVKNNIKFSREWFEAVENHRYKIEPFIHSVAQFTKYHGKTLLEVGVGAGTDHLQWARAGAICYGVDLTEEAIEATTRHLSLYGFKSNLQRINAERLPFQNDFFDIVYSWGVIHHSESPSKIISEIHRVLKPGGSFIGMLYGRRSLASIKLWVRHALLAGKPWRSFSDVIWNHMESIGTKAYTLKEVKDLFESFSNSEIAPIITPAEVKHYPSWIARLVPSSWGFFITIKAVK